MKRHASADELAALGAGALKPRKAGRISAHLAGCAHCTEISNQLSDVLSLLASVPAAPMPPNLSGRIEATLAAESAQRLASEPATEAGRRDLPTRGHRPGRGRQGWRIPGLSGPASRLVAAAGALVIIGAGGYEIATHINAATSSSGIASSGAPAATPMHRVSYGPKVSYSQGSGVKILRAVRSDINFTGRTLGKQAIEALTAARRAGDVPSSAPAKSAYASPQATGLSSASASTGLSNETANIPSQGQMTGCVDKIAAGQAVLLVEIAKFDQQPAVIIVIQSAEPSSADVWAVRTSCAASNTQVLDQVRIAHT